MADLKEARVPDIGDYDDGPAIERLGAKRDGLIRNHQILDGRVRDTVLYSILASEWEGVKRNLAMKLARAAA